MGSKIAWRGSLKREVKRLDTFDRIIRNERQERVRMMRIITIPQQLKDLMYLNRLASAFQNSSLFVEQTHNHKGIMV
jgi:hypothetical protein